jgi:hypothetical protein
MDNLIYVIVGAVILLILLFSLRGRVKRIWFKIPFFGGGVATHKPMSLGGRGGNASAVGSKSTAIGGKGGAGGPGGHGGDGGSAEAAGDNSFAMGGEGGEAGQANRGGKGGRGPLHALMEDHPDKFKEISDRFGVTEEMATVIGKGGDGGSN